MSRSAKKLVSALHLSEEPVAWALLQLFRRVWLKSKSIFLAKLLGAPGIFLGPRCHIRGVKSIQFGDRFYAHSDLWLEAIFNYRGQQFQPQIIFGPGMYLSAGVHISCIERIEFKGDTLIGSHVYISDHGHGVYNGTLQSHPRQHPAERTLGGGGPVVIEKNVWIGNNAVLVGPLVIGEGTIIGANSIVRKSTAPYSMVAGVPAREIKRFDPDTARWERIPSDA